MAWTAGSISSERRMAEEKEQSCTRASGSMGTARHQWTLEAYTLFAWGMCCEADTSVQLKRLPMGSLENASFCCTFAILYLDHRLSMTGFICQDLHTLRRYCNILVIGYNIYNSILCVHSQYPYPTASANFL